MTPEIWQQSVFPKIKGKAVGLKKNLQYLEFHGLNIIMRSLLFVDKFEVRAAYWPSRLVWHEKRQRFWRSHSTVSERFKIFSNKEVDNFIILWHNNKKKSMKNCFFIKRYIGPFWTYPEMCAIVISNIVNRLWNNHSWIFIAQKWGIITKTVANFFTCSCFRVLLMPYYYQIITIKYCISYWFVKKIFSIPKNIQSMLSVYR